MELDALVSKIAMPAQVLWNAWGAVRRMRDSAGLAGAQIERLRTLVHYAYRHTKYYRERLDQEGLQPDCIRRVEDLAKLPFLTKEDLRRRFWELIPREISACRVTRTSGSTGIPVCVLSDRSSRIRNSSAVLRYRQALGIGLWGRPILTPLKTAQDPWDRQPHWTFVQGIHKTFYVNPYNESEENGAHVRGFLSSLNGAVVIGITPAVVKLAHRVKDGLFPAFRPYLALTSGAVLTPEDRRTVEETLDTRVIDIYGCNEGGDIAWQCHRQEGYHVNADNVIVEIVRDGKPVLDGQIGEVVITNLNRFAMPIIRYKNGDLARVRMDQCPCGCKLPMIAEIIGRQGEDIRMSDGSTMPWHEIKSLIYHPDVRQFQIVQDSDQDLMIRYVREPDTNPNTIEEVVSRRLRNRLGDRMRFTFQPVSQIAPEKSGKYKVVVSNLDRCTEHPGEGGNGDNHR